MNVLGMGGLIFLRTMGSSHQMPKWPCTRKAQLVIPIEQADREAPWLQFEATDLRYISLQKRHRCIKSIDQIGTKTSCYFVLDVIVTTNLTSDLCVGISWGSAFDSGFFPFFIFSETISENHGSLNTLCNCLAGISSTCSH